MCEVGDTDVNEVLSFLAGNRRFKGIKEQAQVSHSPLAVVLMLRLPDCVCASIPIKISLSHTQSQFPTGVCIRGIVDVQI